MKRYPVWRRAGDLVLTRATGHRDFRVENHSIELRDYFEAPLDLDSFLTGPSDYEMPSDEVYCPCGDALGGWDGTAGELLRLIYQHCENKGHPRPVFER